MAQLSGRQPRYKRILLKLSGEALMGSEEFGIDPKVLDRMALERWFLWAKKVPAWRFRLAKIGVGGG